MAARYPTRDEWDDMAGLGLSPEAQRLAQQAVAADPKRKNLRLERRAKLKTRRRRPSNLNVSGLLPEREYLALKEQVYGRAGWRCERCGHAGTRAGLHRLTPHHRKLLSQGGYDAAENLAALCAICHDWCHDHPAEAMAAGWIVPSYEDPATYPMLLPDGRRVRLTAAAGYSLAA